MGHSYWNHFIRFIKNSLTEKFKVFFPGVGMGFIGAKHLLWIGVSISMVEGAFKAAGTIVMAFGSGLATSYAAYLVDRYKEKKSRVSGEKRRRKRA